MPDTATVILILIGALGTAAAIVTVLVMLRKPRLSFALMQLILPIRTGDEVTEVSMLAVRVENKKHTLGAPANSVQCSILYTGTVGDDPQMRSIMNRLPWMKNYQEETMVAQALRDDDYPRMLESVVFDRTPHSIPQGHPEMAVVSFGIRKYKKLYHATKPPLPLRVPANDKQMVMNPFRLEIAGSNVPSTVSQGTVLMVTSEGQWIVPSAVTELGGPNGFRNFLLRTGLKKREQEIIPWADVGQMKLRELRVAVNQA